MLELRSHRVARCAYQRVVAHDKKEYTKGYAALAHKLPGMILQNGLAQASGFLLAKGKEEHLRLLDDLLAILTQEQITQAANRDALHQEIIAADLKQTLRLTRSALESSGWIKRYVQGTLRLNASGENSLPQEKAHV